MSSPLIIGITGGSGSGKSLFLDELLKNFSENEICLVSQDNYYIEQERQPVDENGVVNYDLPESVDLEKFYRDILSLREGREVRIREYTFNNPLKKPKEIIFKPAPILIIEGIFVFCRKEICDLTDLSVFIDATELIKVKRRILRDAKERGYDLHDVLYRYEYHVTPFYEQFLRPLKHNVDLVIPNNKDFANGLSVLSGYIKNRLRSN